MQMIKDWLLSKRSYTYGCILYNRFGNNEELKQLFSKGPTPFTTNKLASAMQEIITGDPPKKAKISRGEMPPVENDKVLKALRDQWMPSYTKMNYKRHELDKYLFLTSQTAMHKRAKLAMEILKLEKECMRIWAKRDHYIEFGKLPDQSEKPEPVVDPMRMALRYKNVQGYIRRYKYLLRRGPANAENVALLKRYEEEFAELKSKIA